MRYSKLRQIEMRLGGKKPVRRKWPRSGRMTGRRVRILCICILAVTLCFLIFAIRLNLKKPRVLPPRESLNLESICMTDEPENNWKYIVIHHSATESGNAANFDRYHRKVKHWKFGLAYHFVIGNGSGSDDGEIEVGTRWRKQIHGAHTANMDFNRIAIGICIVGNLEDEMLTPKQFDSIYQIILHLSRRYSIPLSNIIMHNQVIQKKGTLCPGKNFPYTDLTNKLANVLASTVSQSQF